MTSTSFGHTSKVLLVIFAAFYALLVVWCLFGQVFEEDAMAEYYDGGFSGASEERFHFPFSQTDKRSIRHRRSGTSYSHGYAGYTYPLQTGTLLSTGNEVTNGLYTTSAARVRSYGGSNYEMERTITHQSSSETENVSERQYTPSLSYPTGKPSVSIITDYEQSVSMLSSISAVHASPASNGLSSSDIRSAGVWSNPLYPYSAESISPANSRRNANGFNIESAWIRWLALNFGDQTLLSLPELQRLFEEAMSNGSDYFDNWDEFYNWFLSQQDSGREDFPWTLPVGDGIGVLLVLTLSLLIYRILQNKLHTY